MIITQSATSGDVSLLPIRREINAVNDLSKKAEERIAIYRNINSRFRFLTKTLRSLKKV